MIFFERMESILSSVGKTWNWWLSFFIFFKLPNTSPNLNPSFVWKTWKISFWISYQFSFLHFFVVIFFSFTYFLYLWLHHLYIFFWFFNCVKFDVFIIVLFCSFCVCVSLGATCIICILVLSHLSDVHCCFILVLHQ